MVFMKCPKCQTVLGGRKTPACCPLCGAVLEKNPHSSFEKTWADLEEQQLKKKPSVKQFNAVYGWYQKAMQNSLDETVDAAAFLRRYPELAAKAGKSEKTIEEILVHGAENGSAACARILVQEKPEWKVHLLEFLKDRDPEEYGPEYALLINSWKGEYGKARQAYREICKLPEDRPFALESDLAKEMLTGLDGECEGRRKQMDAAASQGNVRFLLDALCRPLNDPPQAFNHLFDLSEPVMHVLQTESDSWMPMIEKDLEAGVCLRGFHLFLQTMKNTGFEADPRLDALLAKQYEKAYLRPFEEIEATDLLWMD